MRHTITNLVLRMALLVALASSVAMAQGKVLVLTPMSKDFVEAVNALKSNLSDMQVKTVEVKDDTPVKVAQAAIQEFKPNLVVLLDNKALRLYKQYLVEVKNVPAVPTLAMMALQIEASISDMPNAVGISYEIPAVTTISRLRTLLDSPIKKAGVVYRASMESFYQDNRKFCKVENIDLVGVKISDQAESSDLQRALNELVSKHKVDAIWIINDNKLLNATTIKGVWMPFMKSNPMPAIVGVESLAQTKLNLGTFAVLPDHSGLGAQAANLIYEISDNDWVVDEKRVDKPLSVIQILNVTIGQKVAKLKKSAPKSVDRVLE